MYLLLKYIYIIYLTLDNLNQMCFIFKVVPVMINYLPLHEDFVENLTVFRCLVYLYEIGNPYMVSLSEPVIKASLITLNDRRKYDNGNVYN